MTDKINIKLTGFALLVPFVDVAQDYCAGTRSSVQILKKQDLESNFKIQIFLFMFKSSHLMDQSLTNPGGREKPSVRLVSSNGITRLRICF